MSNRKSNSLKRKLAILNRSIDGCLLFNREWCFALTSEPEVKWLLKNKMIKIGRSGSKRSKATLGRITDIGLEFLRKHNDQKCKN